MKKHVQALFTAALMILTTAGCGQAVSSAPPDPKDADPGAFVGVAATAADSVSHPVYPKGTLVLYTNEDAAPVAQRYRQWLDAHPEQAGEVKLSLVQCADSGDARDRLALISRSGDAGMLPDAVQTDAVQLVGLAENGLVADVTDLVQPIRDELVPGALEGGMVNGACYALPDALSPRLLFYNQDIFTELSLDPARMETVEGYLDTGRAIRERSAGKIRLTALPPDERLWTDWGRQYLMPIAGGRVWDADGKVVFAENQGTKRALGTLDALVGEGLALRVPAQAPLYDAVRAGEIATLCAGAVWDGLLRQNTPETGGDWRTMPAPRYGDVGLRGPPIVSMTAIVRKPGAQYAGLIRALWYDVTFSAGFWRQYAQSTRGGAVPFQGLVSKDLKSMTRPPQNPPDPFYGGQSIQEAAAMVQGPAAPSLTVTASDAQADRIISEGLEKWTSGGLSMEEAAARIHRRLADDIGRAVIR